MLLIYSDQKRWADVTESEAASVREEYGTVTQQFVQAGVMRGGDPLESATGAKTVAAGGTVTDGPFAETAEVLGGYYILETPDIDTALQWAAKLPGVDRGLDKIEVRQVAEIEGP
jgi:hypothetical protein